MSSKLPNKQGSVSDVNLGDVITVVKTVVKIIRDLGKK